MSKNDNEKGFKGANKYILDDELAKIVNITMELEMPLLLKGEPGTGKTMLAHAIAESLRMPLIVLNVKSSMKLVESLYQYDTLTRLNDSRFGDSKRDASRIEDYIKMGKIGQAFTADQRTVLLIDEIDKADTDFQDDMLDVLDQMEFDIIEIDKTIQTVHRPVFIITSNAKKDLSDPFLGRCNFHHIAFPDPKMMRKIINVHFPNLAPDLMENSIATFYRLREIDTVEKKPATRELINWIRALDADPDFKAKQLAKGDIPFLGVLFKKSQDYVAASNLTNRRKLF
ncbi:MAG: MoxR family ATPase [Desulfobacteraceae bacterium]|nr:MoxR family ATPase [Desulfobacteraceae bacterium]MBC2758103.1 MoxR family ATPase [Desulfobacteraceae bacterium]